MKRIIEQLRSIEKLLHRYESLAVAVSGGMDSSFLAYLAKNALGSRMIALMAHTQFGIAHEMNNFASFAQRNDIPLSLVHVDIFANEDVIQNNINRCYYCKKEIFNAIIAHARQKGFHTIADGTNSSDEKDFRPGRKAIEELNIVSPLAEVGFTKEDIINAVNYLQIEIPTRYSNSCLATRIEYGTRITHELLQIVHESESMLWKLGIEPVRVRIHREIARIETVPQNIQKIVNDNEMRKAIVSELKSRGIKHVTIDIEGYRTGSMNR
ncbi:MAG: ATP-dependent sacrificial sulfur transferase LarE [Spirochaetes bacterium]|nr:ATP-dependent sacrificial sulfur transferase LarE [Spirochaetota bacterium]